MNNLPRQTLITLIAQHGSALSEEPRRVEAFLRDLCGQHKREIFVLVNALKCRIAADLLNSKGVPPELLLARLTQRLEDEMAVNTDAACWAVETWAVALGVARQTEQVHPKSVSAPKPVYSSPAKFVTSHYGWTVWSAIILVVIAAVVLLILCPSSDVFLRNFFRPYSTRPTTILAPTNVIVLPTSIDGRIAFASNRDGNFEIYAMNIDGSGQANLTNNAANDITPAWSPNGFRIAFSSDRDGNNEVYVMNSDGNKQVNLTNNDSALDAYPAWSPDGTRLAFTSNRDGNPQIYVMNAVGSEQTNLTKEPGGMPTWSPDRTRIAFESNLDGNNEIYVINTDGSELTNLTNNSATDASAAWSSDGMRIVFTSDRDGNHEIYVMDIDGSEQVNLTNNLAPDFSPSWSPDGTHIAFTSSRDGNNEIYVMNADGSRQTNLTNSPKADILAAWSPN